MVNPTREDSLKIGGTALRKADERCEFVHVGLSAKGNLHKNNLKVTSIVKTLVDPRNPGRKTAHPNADGKFVFYLGNPRVAGRGVDVDDALEKYRASVNNDLFLDVDALADHGSAAYRAYKELLDTFKKGECEAVSTTWTLDEVYVISKHIGKKGGGKFVIDKKLTESMREAAKRRLEAKGGRDFLELATGYYESLQGIRVGALKISGSGDKFHVTGYKRVHFGANKEQNTRAYTNVEARLGGKNIYVAIPRDSSSDEFKDVRRNWEKLAKEYRDATSVDTLISEVAEAKRNEKGRGMRKAVHVGDARSTRREEGYQSEGSGSGRAYSEPESETEELPARRARTSTASRERRAASQERAERAASQERRERASASRGGEFAGETSAGGGLGGRRGRLSGSSTASGVARSGSSGSRA